MEESSNDKEFYKEINHITFEQRSVLRFLVIGWIIIGFFGLLAIGNPAFLLVYLVIALTDRIYYLITKKELSFLAKFGRFLSKLCFGATHEHEGNIRVWWTFLLGFVLFDFFIVILVYTSWLVIPIILLIAHKENVLKGLYTLVFLPRNSKIINPHWEERKRKQALKDDELLVDWQETYMYQLGPDKASRVVAVSSFIIAGGI
ncbi:MAG: hypothetical protein KAR35_10330, partial [Candidatus Heimdallarchaeota archaeon]|nr:hypothetical protein [Candidatus Heimdallarchaeota archaeon]MCK5049753.1 hypothetical protein [Candidatus Heimdallarchaeota archaeon]